MKMLLAVVVPLVVGVPAALNASEERRSLTPSETAARYFEAIAANDLDAAEALVAMPDGRTDEIVREFNARLAEHFRSHARIKVVAHLALEDVAVVVCCQRDPRIREMVDVDPMYCVRNDGMWFVTFEGQLPDSPDDWSEEGRGSRLRKVVAWFESQSDSLRDLLQDLVRISEWWCSG